MLIASGALSHTFWPLRELREHEAAGVEHIFTAEAYQADRERIDWLGKGDHARVLDTMPEFLAFRPEARFAHYLMMAGALGEGGCTAPASAYSDYENSVGTGQMHLWFARPARGWAQAGPADAEWWRPGRLGRAVRLAPGGRVTPATSASRWALVTVLGGAAARSRRLRRAGMPGSMIMTVGPQPAAVCRSRSWTAAELASRIRLSGPAAMRGTSRIAAPPAGGPVRPAIAVACRRGRPDPGYRRRQGRVMSRKPVSDTR